MAYDFDQMRAAQAQADLFNRLNRNVRSDAADAFAYAASTQQPKRPASRFAGPDVIDLVQGPDGAWRVPAHLEHRMREP